MALGVLALGHRKKNSQDQGREHGSKTSNPGKYSWVLVFAPGEAEDVCFVKWSSDVGG